MEPKYVSSLYSKETPRIGAGATEGVKHGQCKFVILSGNPIVRQPNRNDQETNAKKRKNSHSLVKFKKEEERKILSGT
jgi:hypothetical protein